MSVMNRSPSFARILRARAPELQTGSSWVRGCFQASEAFAVIFDFDGVIVDSETPEFEAIVRILPATVSISRHRIGVRVSVVAVDHMVSMC